MYYVHFVSWSMIQWSQYGVIMVVVDGLVPIWHQAINNHHDDVSYLQHVMMTYGYAAMLIFYVPDFK